MNVRSSAYPIRVLRVTPPLSRVRLCRPKLRPVQDATQARLLQPLA
jgi:hypothetical protein